MALFKKFMLLPPLRSPESFYATYRGPWPLVKKWPLVYLQTTKKAPKSISVARTEWTDGQRQNYIPPTLSGDNKPYNNHCALIRACVLFMMNMVWLNLVSKQCIYQDVHGTINMVFMIKQCLHEKLLQQTVNILPVFCDFMCFFSCSDCRLIETLGYGEFIVIVYF